MSELKKSQTFINPLGKDEKSFEDSIILSRHGEVKDNYNKPYKIKQF